MNGDVGMGWTMHVKNCGNKEIPLAILSRILAQSCVTLHYYSGKQLRTIVLYSILDSIAKGIPCFHDFSMVHPIPTSPSTQLNDFYTFSYYKCTNCSMVMYNYTASLYAKNGPLEVSYGGY